MHAVARLAVAAATTLALTIPLAGAASADPDSDHGSDPVPSERQVARAKKDVAGRERSVAQIQGALDAAYARLETAIVDAEVASESYNGALWRLSEARKASAQAKARSTRAVGDVEAQRSGIITLVTESYQNGTELTTATALMSDEGPVGLMNRYAVVQSAGDSMEARYERFRVASARAEAYAAKAVTARRRQGEMAKEARVLRDAAGQAAASAGSAANQIAVQKDSLVQALAKAQDISVELATERQEGLEQIAERKRAAAAAAKHAVQEAALKKAARVAAREAAAAKKANKGNDRPSDNGGPTPGPVAVPAPPVNNTPPNPSGGVRDALRYARAQLGKPYQWAAEGPATFDCSGLTMMAWRAGGKSLPHYSVAQFSAGTRISMARAKPGDLLFWSNNGAPSGIHHVAIYIGGGQFIEAPRTGLNVRYNSIYNWYPNFVVRL